MRPRNGLFKFQFMSFEIKKLLRHGKSLLVVEMPSPIKYFNMVNLSLFISCVYCIST